MVITYKFCIIVQPQEYEKISLPWAAVALRERASSESKRRTDVLYTVRRT